MYKKRITKKIVACLLAFVVMATMTEWPMVVNADSSVTVLDGIWEASDATVSSVAVDGASVLQVTKENLEESTNVTNSVTYTVETETSNVDYELQWGMIYRSQNSDCTVRVNIVLYDSNGDQLDALAGDRVMLSRENTYSDWETLYTVATVPAAAVKVSYELIFSSGTADLQVKEIFAKMADVIEREDKSAETGWTAQEVWYPEDETKTGQQQFRYFRIQVKMEEGLKAGTDFVIQMASTHSFSIMKENAQAATSTAIWINGKEAAFRGQCGETYSRRYENGKYIYSQVFQVDNYGLAEKKEFTIGIRGLFDQGVAGLILQGYGILNSDTDNYNYQQFVGTSADNTQVSKLDMGSDNTEFTWAQRASWVDVDANWYQSDSTQLNSQYTWVSAEERGQVPYGNLGEIPFDWRYSDCQGFYSAVGDPSGSTTGNHTIHTDAVKAGEKVTLVRQATDGRHLTENITLQLYKKDDAACNVLATIPTDVSYDSETDMQSFTFIVPDYIAEGTYTARMLHGRYEIGFDRDTDNVLTFLEVSAPTTQKSVVKSEVVSTDNGVRLQIDGTNVSPILYTQPGEDAYYSYTKMSSFANTGVSLYTNFDGRLDADYGNALWVASDDGKGVLDTDALDWDIFQTLNLNPNAMLIVNINMDAPDWWKTANQDQLIKDEDGATVNEVSFASTEYRTAASAIVQDIVEHLSTASYKHRICGIRFSGGETSEWMYYTDSENQVHDYSEVMKNAYNSAYGHSTIPTEAQRKEGSFGALMDISNSTDAAVIQYNEFLSQCITDSVIAYAEAAKTAMIGCNVNWIAGAYNCYLWQENTSGGIGKSHTTCDRILESSFIDFISSPVSYNERVSGYATGYMTMTESIAAHQKLYIVEQDNRTVYASYDVVAGRTDSLGKTYTVEDTAVQLTRDMTTNLVKGNGFWFLDMQGGWYDNDTLESAIAAIKKEYDTSLSLDTSTNSEVAVFVGSETYNYLANDSLTVENNDSYKIMSQLYAAQKVELSKMGTSYDTYMIEDLTSSSVSVDWSQYKLSIILSPFELTSDEVSAIESNLQKNNNYILWVYMPGVSNGSTMSADNISNVTGITTKLYTPNGWSSLTSNIAMSATIDNALFGTVGDAYGTTYEASNAKARIPYILDDSSTTLATYADVSSLLSDVAYSGQPAAAMKNMGTYTSVYSVIPNVPADSLRALCEAAGVHMYTDDKNTVVETNEGYISVYSQVAGDKIVTVPDGYLVYDVFAGKKVTLTNNQFTASLTKDGTRLYRLTKVAEIGIANADFDGVFYDNPIFENWDEKGVPSTSNVSGAKVEKVYEETENGIIQALCLTDDLESTNATYIQDMVENMETGKTYEISFDAKFEGTGAAHFCVQERQSSGYVQKFEKYCTDELVNGWARLSYTFDADYSTNLFRWRILGIPDETTAYYITNVRLKIVDPGEMISNGSFEETSSSGYRAWYTGAENVPDRGPNLLSNGGFESDMTGWSIRSQGDADVAEISTEEKAVGDKALKMTWATTGKSLEVGMNAWNTFSPSTTYTIKFQVKTTDSLMYLQPYLYVKNANGSASIVTSWDAIRGTEGGWKQMTYTYTSPEEDILESNNFLLCFKMGNNPATVYIDDVQIYKKESGTNAAHEVSISKADVTGIDGVKISNNGIYLQTLTTKATRADATYILKMNTALTGTGKARLWVNERTNSNVLLDTFMESGIAATKQKYLITPKLAAVCTVRFQIWEDWAGDTSLSVGNVSMFMNRGDFDEDGTVTDTDFEMMRKALIGHTEAVEAGAIAYSDLTADGKGTVADIIRMKLYAAGLK